MAGLLLKRAMVARRVARLHRGDPGFLGNIVKGIGKVVGTVAKVALPVAKVLPGVGTLATIAGGAASILARPGQNLPRPMLPIPTGLFKPGSGHAQRMLSPDFGNVKGGASSTSPFRRRRRMNPMNHKAANRAIRRIKAVRKIVRSIESSLPKQRASARTFGKKKC